MKQTSFSLMIIRFSLVVMPIMWIGCNQGNDEKKKQSEYVDPNPNGEIFLHGVASGDPTQNSVIIWTRVESLPRELVNGKWIVGEAEDLESMVLEGKWKICSDEKMQNTVLEGEFTTTKERDFTVKIFNSGLEQGKYYYYQFEAMGQKSIIGRTKTLPENPEKIKLGFASCSHYEKGYFNAYRLMGDDSLDVVIHLGDYIYEYAYYEPAIGGRKHLPKNELLSVNDYRRRYSQYRQDEDLQYLHSRHPFIVIYDDHELANNAYKDGAQNHDVSEGDWNDRVMDAKKAYYEWMPIAENEGKHYRSFSFGNLANLIMVDTRTDGRTVQPEKVDINNRDTSAHIMSKEQMDWLIKELFKDHQWKIIGNQILFSDISVFFGKSPQLYNDGWSAYRKDHELLENIMAKIMRIILVTGDFHSSFAIKGDGYTEFVIPSITSTNYDEDNGLDSAYIYQKWYEEKNPEITYSNLIDHGYFSLEITPEICKGHFVLLTNIKEKENYTRYEISKHVYRKSE